MPTCMAARTHTPIHYTYIHFYKNALAWAHAYLQSNAWIEGNQVQLYASKFESCKCEN